MALIVGIAGAARNAAVALLDGERVVVCEQERVTRTRRAALRPGELPVEALDAVLRMAGHSKADISTYAVAETAIALPAGRPVERVDHHAAHAATAYYSSPFKDAVVLVCDRSGAPQLTVWRGDGLALTREEFPWTGPGFAEVYSRLAEAFGFGPDGDEHKLEALAHAAGPHDLWESAPITYRGDHLEIPPTFNDSVARLMTGHGSAAATARAAAAASGVQRHVGEVLVQLVSDIKSRVGGRHLCLGGGFFYNSFFTTLLAESGLYERTFVPVNPGNAGVALGAALHVAARTGARLPSAPLSPFLGPDFETNEIKTILDNCKLSYDYADGRQIAERTAGALARGKLVGWFQGRMEWGSRALGNRSILASPVAPFVLENLNGFLKRREPHRSYSVSVCEEDAPKYFRGPLASPFMEYEYVVLQPDVLSALLPLGATRLRVQTVPKSAGPFHTLIKAFGEQTGVPILVNTSFNGFNEPIVCTPRDAVRVFYGTGLDTVAIGGFILQK